MSAALTGHLVLSTVHTIDATQTLQRMMKLFSRTSARSNRYGSLIVSQWDCSSEIGTTKNLSSRTLAVGLLTNHLLWVRLLRELRYQDLEDLMRSSRYHK